jgi:hypothetical protein
VIRSRIVKSDIRGGAGNYVHTRYYSKNIIELDNLEHLGIVVG